MTASARVVLEQRQQYIQPRLSYLMLTYSNIIIFDSHSLPLQHSFSSVTLAYTQTFDRLLPPDDGLEIQPENMAADDWRFTTNESWLP